VAPEESQGPESGDDEWPEEASIRLQDQNYACDFEHSEDFFDRGLGYDPDFGDYPGRQADEEASSRAFVDRMADDSQNLVASGLNFAESEGATADDEGAERFLASQEESHRLAAIRFSEAQVDTEEQSVEDRRREFEVAAARSRADQRRWMEDRQLEAASQDKAEDDRMIQGKRRYLAHLKSWSVVLEDLAGKNDLFSRAKWSGIMDTKDFW
ncbi:hypothetical protein P7C70_g6826, partial [Phenoliferia sp. Uapishka_3]